MPDATPAQASPRVVDAAEPVVIQAQALKWELALIPAAASKVAASVAFPAEPAVAPSAIPADPQVVDGSPVAAGLQDDPAVVDSAAAVVLVWLPALGGTPAVADQAARQAVADPAVDGSPDDSTVVASAAFPVLVAILEPAAIPEQAVQAASAHRVQAQVAAPLLEQG